MKLFVVLAVFLAVANCLPRHKMSSEDSGEDEHPTLTVEEYRNEMQDLVDHVRETKQHVEEFGEVAKKALEATDESDLQDLADGWDKMTEVVDHSFNKISGKLAELGYRLYHDAEGFDEVNYCQEFKNFDSSLYDPTQKVEYVKAMITVFIRDLECFSSIMENVEHVQNALDNTPNGMDEDFAITLVAEFMKGLHVARLNAIRFMEAVDAAAAEMDEDNEEEKREVKKLMKLRSLLKKSGLLSR